jgi:hypothetical protein
MNGSPWKKSKTSEKGDFILVLCFILRGQKPQWAIFERSEKEPVNCTFIHFTFLNHGKIKKLNNQFHDLV